MGGFCSLGQAPIPLRTPVSSTESGQSLPGLTVRSLQVLDDYAEREEAKAYPTRSYTKADFQDYRQYQLWLGSHDPA